VDESVVFDLSNPGDAADASVRAAGHARIVLCCGVLPRERFLKRQRPEESGRCLLRFKALLCRSSRNKAITTADGRDFQVQARVLRMPAFVHDLEVCLMAANDADQHVCLMLFPELSTETALSILNCFHLLILPRPDRLQNNSSMSFVLCKLRVV
jgi:hypothetical protein